MLDAPDAPRQLIGTLSWRAQLRVDRHGFGAFGPTFDEHVIEWEADRVLREWFPSTKKTGLKCFETDVIEETETIILSKKNLPCDTRYISAGIANLAVHELKFAAALFALRSHRDWLSPQVTHLLREVDSIAEEHNHAALITACSDASIDAVEALFCSKHVPQAQLSGLEGAEWQLALPRTGRAAVAVFKSAMAKLCLDTGRAIARLVQAPLPNRIKRTDHPDDLRATLVDLAKTDPELCRKLATSAQQGLQLQFGDTPGLQGRIGRRRIRRWHNAHALWLLMIDVLDVVWPPGSGRANSKQIGHITRIIEAICMYVRPVLPAGHEPEPNYDHVEDLTTKRFQVEALDQHLLFFDEIDGLKDWKPQTSLRLLYLIYYPLQTWSRELVRQIYFGDYHPSRDRARPVEAIKVPRFPQDVNLAPSCASLKRLARLARRSGLG